MLYWACNVWYRLHHCSHRFRLKYCGLIAAIISGYQLIWTSDIRLVSVLHSTISLGGNPQSNLWDAPQYITASIVIYCYVFLVWCFLYPFFIVMCFCDKVNSWKTMITPLLLRELMGQECRKCEHNKKTIYQIKSQGHIASKFAENPFATHCIWGERSILAFRRNMINAKAYLENN